VPSPLPSLRAIAPCIVPIVREQAASQIIELLAHCDARPMLSFLAVPQNIGWETLIEQWEPLHWVSPPDGKRLLLRFADTRTLAILPKVLKPQQWYAWSQGIASWFIINRRGTIQSLPLLEQEFPPITQFDIDEQQLSAFIEAAETDSALNFLNENHPELIPETLTGHDYHLWAGQALDTAQQHNIESFPDRTILIVLNIRRDGKLTEMPELTRLLREGEWEAGKLGSTLLAQPWINQNAHA